MVRMIWHVQFDCFLVNCFRVGLTVLVGVEGQQSHIGLHFVIFLICNICLAIFHYYRFQGFEILCAKNYFVGISAALEKLSEDVEEDGEGTMHFMVNVVQPQFNLDSEEANVCNFSALFFFHFCDCHCLSLLLYQFGSCFVQFHH